MRKILLSLLTVSAVAVVAVVATGAYFNDTETSVDNTFVAGELDLQIDNTTTYYQNDVLAQGYPQSWALKDLVGEKFFNFLDVKPEDYGENTISLHVFDNDAWACMDISPLENNDNTCTEPEDGVDEPGTPNPNGCGTDPDAGELAQNLDFFAWLDDGLIDGFQCPDDAAPCTGIDEEEGDNIWQDETESPLFTNTIGPASDVLSGRTYTLADSNFSILGSGPLIGSTTYYVGLAWCAGTMTVTSGTGDMTGQPDLSCDGTSMGNDTQSDSVLADLTFRAEQWRNNTPFSCQ